MIIIDWNDYSSPDSFYHLTRLTGETGNTYPLHTHRGQLEIMVVTEGSISHRLNGELRRLDKGTALLIEESASHALEGGAGSMINIAFSRKEMARLPLRQNIPVVLEGAPMDRFLEYKDYLEQARGKDQYLLREFLLWFFRRLKPGTRDFFSPAVPDWFSGMLSRWERDSALTREQLLRQISKSPEHISRCFRKYLSCTPGEYLNRLRIKRAEGLILTTRYSITHIAMECGFESISYFYKAFKDANGMAPGEYRKREGVNPYLGNGRV